MSGDLLPTIYYVTRICGGPDVCGVGIGNLSNTLAQTLSLSVL